MVVRILHVVATGQRRGAEMFASDLVAALGRLGVEQAVAVLRAGPPAVPFDAPVTMLGADGRPLPGLRMHLGAVRALRALVRERRPDLLQVHGGEPLKYGLAAAAGAPVVYRRIGSTAGWLSSSPRRLVYGRLIRRAARVVAVSEETGRETAAAFRLPPAQVVTIPNGVDLRRLEPRRDRAATRAALGVPAAAAAILSLGALTWEKDPVGHLETSAPLLARHPGAVHLFAGDGPLRAELAAAADRLGVADRVRLLGSRDDVADLLAASDVMLFASRTEGMPASVIEAGVAGVPVAGTALAGVPEVVVDGETGLLAAPGDGDGLRAALDRLLGDERLRAAMGQAAAARCRERFGVDAIAGAYLALYEELAGAACAAS
jgi:glycosyltransferase involved in cell wall biosynthesis